ncbi:T9SS type A sorting domain-containing protein [Dyadobacter sp. CY323]|uniref:T9SS type A sorting domain-containing protein n=1 Tax=Dyadobacter sp. CY323 TaxID=2907302 RepID=UPI001F48239E|nr:T9SS type A sorting domain-containing protein [Dyadobacter sp. CY323]MCE6988372.1 T9SS type A sorting domain-containing protein [Dyadobacter sp. CY323]
MNVDIFLRKIITVVVLLLITDCSFGQVMIEFRKSELSNDGLEYSFELWALRGAGYNVIDPTTSNWQGLNIRSEMQLPPGVSILSSDMVLNDGFLADGGISSMFFAPPANANVKRFSINLTRTGQNEIPAGGARLAIVNLAFDGVVQHSNMVTVVPFDNTTSGANWVNEVEGIRRVILGPINQALPVTLVSFEITKEAGTAKIKWVTTEETNSERFDVQRSKNGKTWSTFQTVAASGDSEAELTYEATDNDPCNGENLYRLHMIDKDGTSTFSGLRSLFFGSKSTLIYPNPVADYLIVGVDDPEKIAVIDIVNSDGINVYRSASKIEPRIDLRRLGNGHYIVKIKLMNGEETTQRIVVFK